jgi:hypothetical protein
LLTDHLRRRGGDDRHVQGTSGQACLQKKKAGRESGPAKHEGHNLQRGTSPGAMGGKHRAMNHIWGLGGLFSTNEIPKKNENAENLALRHLNHRPMADAFSNRSA